jgi:hypothetical protein
MAIAEDGSTPAVLHQADGTTGSAQSAAFTPPAGTWVYVFATILYGSNSAATSLTCKDNQGSPVTYTAGPNAGGTGNVYSQAFSHFYASSPGSIKVTVTNTNLASAGMYVAARVVTGAASSQAGAGSATAGTLNTSVTTTKAGSWVYVMAGEPVTTVLTLEPLGSTIDSFTDATAGDAAYFGKQTAATTTPGSTLLGYTQAGTGNSLVLLEVLPAVSAAADGAPATVLHPGKGPTQARFYVPPQPTGPPDPPASWTLSAGAIPVTFRPGAGPSNARFYQTPRSADTSQQNNALADSASAADAITVSVSVTGGVASVAFHPGAGPTAARFFTTPRDTGPGSFAAPALADTGIAADTLSMAAAVSLADAGSASDALAVTAAVSVADTGAGTDTLAVSAAVALADAGPAADALTITAAVPFADSGSAADALAVSVSVTDGAAAVAFHPGAGPSAARFFTTPRSTDIPAATTPALADAGSAADILVIAAAIPVADAGSAADALAVTATVPLTDAASAGDVLAVTAAVALAETGAAGDTGAVTASVSLAEAGAAADALAVAAVVTLADPGAAADLLTVVTTGTGPADGQQPAAFHPGRGPTAARFYITPRATDLLGAAAPGLLMALSAPGSALTSAGQPSAALTAGGTGNVLTAASAARSALTASAAAGGTGGGMLTAASTAASAQAPSAAPRSALTTTAAATTADTAATTADATLTAGTQKTGGPA